MFGFNSDLEYLKEAIKAQLPDIEGTEKIVDIKYSPIGGTWGGYHCVLIQYTEEERQ